MVRLQKAWIVVNKIAETATDYSDRPLERAENEKSDGRYNGNRVSGTREKITSIFGNDKRAAHQNNRWAAFSLAIRLGSST